MTGPNGLTSTQTTILERLNKGDRVLVRYGDQQWNDDGKVVLVRSGEPISHYSLAELMRRRLIRMEPRQSTYAGQVWVITEKGREVLGGE